MGQAMKECLGGTVMYGRGIMVSDRETELCLLHARDRSALGLAGPPLYGVHRESPSSTKTIPGHQKSAGSRNDGNKMAAQLQFISPSRHIVQNTV